MKINLVEELSRMKNLFGYERGKVISEQQFEIGKLPFPTYQRTKGSAKEDYPSCVQVFGEPKTDTQGKSYYIKGTGDWNDYYFFSNNYYGQFSITGSKPPHGSFYCKDNVIVLTPVGCTDPSQPACKTQTPAGTVQKQPGANVPKKQKQQIQKPKELTDVKAFQDWLDTNHPGWATGLKDGKLSRGGGYGTFGPRTSAAWKKYGKEYLESLKKGMTKTTEPEKEELGEPEEMPKITTKSPTDLSDITPPQDDEPTPQKKYGPDDTIE